MIEDNTPPTPAQALVNGVKAVGEIAVLPGASLIMDGKVGLGAAHAVGGLLARWALGPVGWVAFGANSLTRSLTGKNILQHLSEYRLQSPVERRGG